MLVSKWLHGQLSSRRSLNHMKACPKAAAVAAATEEEEARLLWSNKTYTHLRSLAK
jgi:hypothetical protein